MPPKDQAPGLPTSVEEMRPVCQQWKRDENGNLVLAGSLYNRFVLRQISIHVTWYFLRLGITANTATLFMTLAGLGGIILGIPHALPLTIIAGVLFFLFDLFDSVDGEIARWNRSSSTRGLYLDQISHVFVDYPSRGVAALHYYWWKEDERYLWLGVAAVLSSVMGRAIREIFLRINAQATHGKSETSAEQSLASKTGLFATVCRQLKKIPLITFPIVKPRLVHIATIVGILLTYWSV